MKSIMACVDFSKTTSAVLEAAVALATTFHAKLYLANVIVLTPGDVGYDAWTIGDATLDRIRSARNALNDLRDPLLIHGVDVQTVLLEEPPGCTQAILEEATRLEASLIIVGSHGHGALYKMLLGSTCEDIVRHSRIPVLIVPAQRPAENESHAVTQARVLN